MLQNFPSTMVSPEQYLFWAAALIIVAAFSAAVTWFFGRPKNQSEIDKLNAETEKTKFTTFALQIDKFHDLLQRIEDAKLKSIEMEQSISRLNFQQAANENEIRDLLERLDACHKNKNACNDMINTMNAFLGKIKDTLDGLPEHVVLANEIQMLRLRLTRER